ncbi:Ig-like domain-containing protein [Pseudoalteromonas sp. YIC-656]|uniref:Ig-like domain-containing protein n=1 Tax=Pseudoalteromonas pernae TaxID=3118054 RepID=UPI003242B6E4
MMLTITGCSENENANAINDAFNKGEQEQTGDLIESIVVKGGNIRIEPGDTLQLTAIGTDLNGVTRDITSEVTWTSSHPESASIDEDGLVSAIAKSDTQYSLVTFTATALGDASETAQVSVKDIAIDTIILSTANAIVRACQPNTINSNIIFTDGYQGKIKSSELIWHAHNNEQTLFSEEGLLYTSAAPGTNLNITASYGDTQSNRYQLDVAATEVTSISFINSNDETVESIDIDLGSRDQLQIIGNLDELSYDITPIIQWQQQNEGLVHIATEKPNNGAILATNVGTGLIYAECTDNLIESLSVEVQSSGTGTLQDISLNDGLEKLSIVSGETQTLTLLANYDGLTNAVNVTDASDVSVSNDLLTVSIKDAGSSNAVLEVKASENVSGASTLTFKFLEARLVVDVAVTEPQ